jgi:hypothetical protein
MTRLSERKLEAVRIGCSPHGSRRIAGLVSNGFYRMDTENAAETGLFLERIRLSVEMFCRGVRMGEGLS